MDENEANKIELDVGYGNKSGSGHNYSISGFPIVVRYEKMKLFYRLFRTLLFAAPCGYLLSFDLFSHHNVWILVFSWLFFVLFVLDVSLYVLTIIMIKEIRLYKDKIVILHKNIYSKCKSIQLCDAKYTATSWIVDTVLTISDYQTRIRIETSLLSSDDVKVFYETLSLLTKRNIKVLKHSPASSSLNI